MKKVGASKADQKTVHSKLQPVVVKHVIRDKVVQVPTLNNLKVEKLNPNDN